MNTKDVINQKIADLDKLIENLRHQIDDAEKQQIELYQQLNNIQRQEIADSCVSCIYEVNTDNSMYAFLDARTKTTPIMDKFYYSKKKFLVFRKFGITSNWKSLSLVVMRSPYQVIKTKDILTMTGLKKLSGAYISSTYLRRPSFAAELFKELSRIPEGKIKEGARIPFTMPCHLGGQTFMNQTGYGSKYEGDMLVHEGTLYGEVTDFQIIGVIVEER